nr:MAG TPA: hypothetical protein [Caudoviricetes sp.]
MAFISGEINISFLIAFVVSPPTNPVSIVANNRHRHPSLHE